MDELKTPDNGEEDRNTKIDFPPVHRRPPFWVEMVIAGAVAYVMGIASIITMEHPEWLKTALVNLVFWRH